MALPPFVADISEEKRSSILEELEAIATGHDVRILFAIESGSRAWGFPSPDSDYDVRFVYAHPLDWYLTLVPGRDVIEKPISDDLDIGGWEVRKALNLLLKPNPVVLEWLSSPIRYLWNDAVIDRLIALSAKTASASACLYHYRHLGETQWRLYVGDRDEVNYKKYFYVLRPALAIRWLRLNPGGMPPMNIQAMSRGLDLDAATEGDIERLLRLKSEAREAAIGDRIPRLDRLIQVELAHARTVPRQGRGEDLVAEADRLFREIVSQGR